MAKIPQSQLRQIKHEIDSKMGLIFAKLLQNLKKKNCEDLLCLNFLSKTAVLGKLTHFLICLLFPIINTPITLFRLSLY